MSETKFTPGPWEVREQSGGGSRDICLPVQPGDLAVAVVATVFGSEADAHLIAAAPELHVALEALCNGIGIKLWENARAALRKARGETV